MNITKQLLNSVKNSYDILKNFTIGEDYKYTLLT